MPCAVPPRDARQRQEDQERQRLEQQRQMEEQRRQEEERRRQEEARRRHEEEEARKRHEREEEQKKRELEAKKRREEEEARKRETAAALAVRKVIQRVRIATPETYDNLRAELEETLADKLEAMGTQGNKVSEEAEQTLKQAQRRIDEINEKRAEEERQREEEAKKRKEENERVEKLLKEASEQLKTAEEKVGEAEEAAQKVPEGKEATPEATIEAVDVAGKVYEDAQVVVDKVVEWFNSKRQELADDHASRNNVMEYEGMCSKVQEGKKTVTAAADKAKAAREQAGRKAVALKKADDRRLFFEKCDQDKDGKLSRKEVEAFSMDVHGFEIPSEVLSKIMGTLEPVTLEKFRPLQQKVAIAKLEAKTRAKREKLKQERGAFLGIEGEAERRLGSAEGHVGQAEFDAKPLTQDVELTSMEMERIAQAAQTLVRHAEEELEKATVKLTQAEEACMSNKDLSFENKGALRHRQERVQTRLARVAATVKKAQEQAVVKAAIEIDVKFTEFVAAISKQEKTGEQIFAELSTENIVKREKFVAFVSGLPDLKFAEGEAERLYAHIVGEAGGDLGKERFFNVIRMYYKCVKSTVLSEDLAIKAKTLRRLEEGELLEALEGPCKEETCGVQRVKCKALLAGVTGWVTLQGNQGTPYLTQEGNFISVTAAVEKAVAEKLAAEKAAAEKLAAETAAAEKAAAEASANETAVEKKQETEKPVEETEKPAEDAPSA